VSDKIENGAGAPPRRTARPMRPEGGPSPRRPDPFRHLAHVPSFRDNPIVFFTTCTYKRRRILASHECQNILHEIWLRSADHDGWWVGNYILMPDHVHFFARPEIDARPAADWVQMWKSVSSRRIGVALAVKQPILGNANISIVIFGLVKITQKNGITLNKTRCGRGLSRRSMHGRMAGPYMT
jgi:REP element-mobilizing transposase RayT